MKMNAIVPNSWHIVAEGKSVESRWIKLYSNQQKPAQLDTLILGAFHGDEPESADLAYYYLQNTAPESLKKPIGVIPVVNPDGLERGTRQNARHVDLNRNFDTGNWKAEPVWKTPKLWLKTVKAFLTSRDANWHPRNQYYGGPKAASEPETQFIQDVIKTYRPKKIVSLHSPYRVNNYDGPAEGLANAMAKENGYPVKADIGYPTPGSFGNYCGIVRHIPTVTLELPAPPYGKWTAAEKDKNFKALEAAVAFELAPVATEAAASL